MSMKFQSPLPCLVCGKVLENVVDSDWVQNQPYDACTFNSPGHYGSTVFDEMDGSRLEVNVCDECLVKAREVGHVGYWPGHPKRRMGTWT